MNFVSRAEFIGDRRIPRASEKGEAYFKGLLRSSLHGLSWEGTNENEPYVGVRGSYPFKGDFKVFLYIPLKAV